MLYYYTSSSRNFKVLKHENNIMKLALVAGMHLIYSTVFLLEEKLAICKLTSVYTYTGLPGCYGLSKIHIDLQSVPVNCIHTHVRVHVYIHVLYLMEHLISWFSLAKLHATELHVPKS